MRNPFRPHIVQLGVSQVFAIRKWGIFRWVYQSRTSPEHWWPRSSSFFRMTHTPDLRVLRIEYEIYCARPTRFTDADYARCLLQNPEFGHAYEGMRYREIPVNRCAEPLKV